jgi:hypothetical protein
MAGVSGKKAESRTELAKQTSRSLPPKNDGGQPKPTAAEV